MDFSKKCECPLIARRKGGGPCHLTKLRGSGVPKPLGAHDTVLDAFPQASQTPDCPVSLYNMYLHLKINTKLLKQQIHSFQPLHIDPDLTHQSQYHKIQFTLIPLQFYIPLCIANLFRHLEGLFAMIVAIGNFIGSLGDHS